MPSEDKVRLAVFGSFYRGREVLREALHGPLARLVQVVGVATDDPSQSYVSPHKRVWQYPHEPWEERMVTELAEAAGIEVYDGRVKTEEFYALFSQRWRPDLCIMATFGQRIDAHLFDYPRLGFYNLHPCLDDGWPSRYRGGNPFAALMAEGRTHGVIALHRVDADFDTGELIAYSPPFPLPPDASVVEMHKLTAPVAAELAARELERIILAACSAPSWQPNPGTAWGPDRGPSPVAAQSA